MTIEKPPMGSPCNRCGYCCRMELCQLGADVFGDQPGPCPALITASDGVATCGLMAKPAAYARKIVARAAKRHDLTLTEANDALGSAAQYLMGAGRGCDSPDGDDEASERAAREWRDRVDAAHDNPLDQIRIIGALGLWGVLR